MTKCPMTGEPCSCDKVFQITETVGQFRYSTDCCRNCVEGYVRGRNDAAEAEEAYIAEQEAAIQAQAKPATQPTYVPASNVQDLLAQMLGVNLVVPVKAIQPAPDKRCPGCNCTIHDVRKMKKLGCPRCYETFAVELGAYLPKVQAGNQAHTGKAPKPSEAVPLPAEDLPANAKDLVEILQQEMERAIAEENYEKAGKCRDLIKKYGGTVAD